MSLYLDDAKIPVLYLHETVSRVDYDMISITSYNYKDDECYLKKTHFKNMNDEDMRNIKDMLVLKVTDEIKGGWIIDESKKKILMIKWNNSNKTYDIIYKCRIYDSFKIYDTYKTSKMIHLAISATKLKKYKEMKNMS